MPVGTAPPSGMRDFLPEDVRRREYAISVIQQVYEGYGFEPLETPALENLETLLGKYGEEGNKLIFKIMRRGVHEATGQADLGLRYDLTVPLARVVGQGKLPRIFKRYQIQPVWRADRPGHGRFREFYQCDVDSLGSTSPIVEAELCGAVADVLRRLGFHDFVIRLNHRALLTAVLNVFEIPTDVHDAFLVILDKLDKIGLERVSAEWKAKGGVQAAAIEGLISAFEPTPPKQDSWAKVEHLAELLRKSGSPPSAIDNLREIRTVAECTSARDHLVFDPSLARGLSYYTGAIMEVNVLDLAGSLGAGGRYDSLVGMFSGQQIPACGFSLGLERILVVMTERSMFPPSLATSPADVMVTFLRTGAEARALEVASELRAETFRVFLYPEPDKADKHNKYAFTRGIRFIAQVSDSDDLTVTLKDRSAQKASVCTRAALASEIRRLRHG